MEEEKNLWWRKLGFYTNPFTIKPAAFDNKVYGQEEILEDLYYKIPAGTISFVEGRLGTGKTTVLKHLISKFRGKGKVIYFACNRLDSELNIEDLLSGKYGFWGRLFKMMPKDMIVLLDESQQLSPANTERIKYFFDQGNIKSVIFTGTDYNMANFHESIRERIGKDGLFKVKELSDDEAIALIRNRIGNSKIVSDELLLKLWKMSNKNPRRLLQRCDKIFRYAVENMESEVKESHLKEIFKEQENPVMVEKPMVLKSKKKASKKKYSRKKEEKDSEEEFEDLFNEEEASTEEEDLEVEEKY